MIRTANLAKYYGAVHALDGLDLQVERGVVYGFLGPNGAGKTTTMRLLTGMARPTSGKAWLMDQELSRASQSTLRARLGVLPEEPAFYPWMTADEYLRVFVAPLYGLAPRAARERAAALLAQVGLAQAARRRIAGFSRGMRQRLGLAQALIHQPQVLLLDEPLSALDPAGRKEILDLIESLRGQTTIMFSSHILADVERVCDVVGIIAKGRMVLQAPRAELLARYALPVYEVEIEGRFGDWPTQAGQLPGVHKVTVADQIARIWVEDVAAGGRELLGALANANLAVRRFESLRPSLEDIFLRLTENGGADPADLNP
jgi:ABC-2 type transport system ATP-binding protein